MGGKFAVGNWISAAAAVAAVALAGVLLAEIIRTEQAQQEVAAEAMTDYADVAAWQYLRRAEMELERSLGPALGAFRDEDAVEAPLDNLLEDALEAAEACPCPHGTQPALAFRLKDGSLEQAGAEIGVAPQALEAQLAKLDPPEFFRGGLGADVRFTELDGETVVVARIEHEASDPVIAGYLARSGTLREVLGDAWHDHEVLPEALLDGMEPESVLGVRVRAGDEVLFETEDFSGPWHGGADFGEMTELFSGLEVETVLAPAAADALLLGGAPRSRLPLLTALLAVAVILGTVAAWQFLQQRRLVRMRADTVARISHELRTPLAQIRLFADTLRLGRSRGEADRDRALAVIDRETRRLDHLVHNVLRFGARERETETLNRRELDLGRFIEEVADEFRPLAEHAGARLETRVEDHPRVSADPEALRRVLLNLLDNAAKHSPDGGTVLLGAETGEDGRVCIRVDDEGPGVADQARERIWEMYDRPAGNGAPGSGIGLAVVRHYVAAHGGEARVETAPGGGARFVVELPGV